MDIFPSSFAMRVDIILVYTQQAFIAQPGTRQVEVGMPSPTSVMIREPRCQFISSMATLVSLSA
jgi:hypothetical protein